MKKIVKIIALLLLTSCSTYPLLKTTGTVVVKNEKGSFVSFPSKDNKSIGGAWFDIEANEGDTLVIIKK